MEDSTVHDSLTADDTIEKKASTEEKPEKIKTATKNTKKNKVNKSDIWAEINVREEKKALKRIKKAKLKETHLDELVGNKLFDHGVLSERTSVKSTSNKQSVKGTAYDKNAPKLNAKNDSATKKGVVTKQGANNDKHNADEMQNMIQTPISKIIDNAEKKRLKSNEKSLTERKIKRALKQVNSIDFSHHSAKDHDEDEDTEEYLLHKPFAMLSPSHEHAFYANIMEHGKHVSRYAQMLFTGLEPLHELSNMWLRCLLLAAQYHDVGTIDSSKSHHKHSYIRIKSDFGILIADEDREMVALLARYHRKAMPCQEHEEFAKLSIREQKNVCKVASILRIADAFDYGHQGLIKKIDVHINHSHVTFTCHSCEDLAQELSRILKKGELFERTFKKEIRCKQA